MEDRYFSTETLEDCPFCGSHDLIFYKDEPDISKIYRIVCRHCGFKIEIDVQHNFHYKYPPNSKQKIVDFWNSL